MARRKVDREVADPCVVIEPEGKLVRASGRSGARESQVVRALALLVEMARSRRGVLLKTFAEKNGYTLRSVYRDRDVLLKLGAPIQVNPESAARWQLLDGWLPPRVVGAEKQELLALYVARLLAPGLRGTSVGRALDQLWSKLASSERQHVLPLEDTAMPFSLRASAAIDYTRHRVTLDVLEEAIRTSRAVRIRYRTPVGDETERVIEPGFLHWDGGLEAIYVPSWCRLRQAVRVFAVHRIVSIAVLPAEPATARPPRRALERAFRLWYRDRVEHVCALFAKRVAGEIRERQWHSSQRLAEEANGGVYLHLDIAAPEELERWLLGFGAEVRVIEPVGLADRVRRAHAEAAGVGQLVEAGLLRRSSKGRGARVSTRTLRARGGS